MATLPDARALGERPQIQPSGSVASYNVTASNRGAGLVGAGNDLAAAGAIIEQTNQHYDNLAAEDAYNKLQAAKQDLEINPQTGFRNVQGGNATGPKFLVDNMERFAGASAEIGGGLANNAQKARYKQLADIAGLQYRGALLSHQAQQTDIFAKSVFEDTRATELNNVATNYENPLMFDAARARLDASVDAEAERTGQGGEWARTQKDAVSDALTVTRLQAWTARDPVGALAQFQQDRGQMNPAKAAELGRHIFEQAKPVLASRMLTGDLRTTAGSVDEARMLVKMSSNMGIHSSVNVEEPDAKRVDSSNPAFDALPINQKVEVMHAARILKDQGMSQARQDLGDTIKDAMASYLATGTFPNPPSEQQLVEAYGPDKGRRIAVDLDQTRKVGAAMQQIGSLSPLEKAAALADLTPVPGDGFASAQERKTIYAKAVAQSDKMIADDPSGYALNNSPMVKTAYAALQGANPADVAQASSRYAQATYAEQRRLGVADPKILPGAMAEQVVASFNKETGNGDNMATRIAGAARQWGNYWPDVYKQLATEFKGQLPDSFLTIPGVAGGAAREEVARLDHVKLEDLEKQVQHTDVKGVKEAVQAGLKPWAESMLANQTNSNLYQAVQNAATKMALVRVQKGQSVGGAVDAATSSFVGQFDFSGVGSVNKYMIPKSEAPEQVVSGVRSAMAALALQNIGAPPYGDMTGLRKPEELAREWKEIVAANPLWVTSGDQSGLKLYAIGKDGRQYPVNTPDGRQVSYTWDALRSFGVESPTSGAGSPVDALVIQRGLDAAKAARRAADLEQEAAWKRERR